MNGKNSSVNHCQNIKWSAKHSRIAAYDCLRVIVTLLIVVGLSTYYKIITDHGGCNYTSLVDHGFFFLDFFKR